MATRSLLRFTIQVPFDFRFRRLRLNPPLRATGEFSLFLALPMGAGLGFHPGYARLPTR